MTDPTCAERIGDHLEGRLEDFRDLATLGYAGALDTPENADRAERQDLADVEHGETREEAARERIREYPLAVSITRTIRVDLSTGGPGDWLEVQVDEDLSPGRVEYHFNDWFDHASRVLEDDERQAAVDFCELLGCFEPGVVVPS